MHKEAYQGVIQRNLCVQGNSVS